MTFAEANRRVRAQTRTRPYMRCSIEAKRYPPLHLQRILLTSFFDVQPKWSLLERAYAPVTGFFDIGIRAQMIAVRQDNRFRRMKPISRISCRRE